jgi:hypothetical protein
VLLDLELPPILPDPLPSSLEAVDGERIAGSFALENEVSQVVQGGPRGSTFDDSVLEPEVRARFLRNLAAVTDVLSGKAFGKLHKNTGWLLQRFLGSKRV